MTEEIKVEKKVKKVDLLGFQKSLNDQFVEIFESKKRGLKSVQDSTSDLLGLVTNYGSFLFFIPLKNLRSISMNNKYESIIATKSWVAGFNQEHGEVYTVFSFKKILDLIFFNATDKNKVSLGLDSRIVYMNDVNGLKGALLLDSLKLEYTAEFTKVVISDLDGEYLKWNMSEEIDFNAFVKKENMSQEEWSLISKVKTNIDNKKKVLVGDYTTGVKDRYDLMSLMVKDVYLDMYGTRPIFMVNVDNLVKYLTGMNPY